MNSEKEIRLRATLNEAIESSMAIKMIYLEDEKASMRYFSPYHFESNEIVIGLCLCRSDVRRFDIRKIYRLRIVSSDDVLAPERIVEVDAPFEEIM